VLEERPKARPGSRIVPRKPTLDYWAYQQDNFLGISFHGHRFQYDAPDGCGLWSMQDHASADIWHQKHDRQRAR
jgi:hypothetical protein